MPVKSYPFTQNCKEISKRLISHNILIEMNGKTLNISALWDTGATCTCISKRVISILELKPISKTTILTPSGCLDVPLYLINLTLPNGINIKDVVVCGSEIGSQGIDVLIGMDIITLGDFAVSNFNNDTTFSFRIPSVETIDFNE